MIKKGSDQVFAVSLSEIAFLLVFVLMLLLGYMVMDRTRQIAELRGQIRDRQTAEDAHAAIAVMNAASSALHKALQGTIKQDPTELVNEAIRAGALQTDNERLRQEKLDLERRIVLLEEFRQELEQVGKSMRPDLTRKQIEEAINFVNAVEQVLQHGDSDNATSVPVKSNEQRRSDAIRKINEALTANRTLHAEVSKQLGIHIKPGMEPETIKKVVDEAHIAMVAAKDSTSPTAMQQHINRLQETVAYYENRFKGRGLDHPPCWADAQGSIEYIFNVQTTPAGYVVTRAWPQRRSEEAPKTRGFDVLMEAPGTAISTDRFIQGAKAYLDFGRSQSPECRHFVYLSTTIPDADRRDMARKVVNGYFYVLEVSQPRAP